MKIVWKRNVIKELKRRIGDNPFIVEIGEIESIDIDEPDDFTIADVLGGTQFRMPCDIAFRIMQTRWNLYASQMVYVGDNPAKDFQAPQQLGMKSIYFRNLDGLYVNNIGSGETIKRIIDFKI